MASILFRRAIPLGKATARRAARWNQRAAFFGAEDTMVVGADVGHMFYSAVPFGTYGIGDLALPQR